MGTKLSAAGQMVQLGHVRRAQAEVWAARQLMLRQCVRSMALGCTGDDVAEALGVSRMTLYRWLDELDPGVSHP